MRIEEELYKELIDKINTYHPTKEFDMIEKAYHLAVEAHKDQKRKSGEPYIIMSLIHISQPTRPRLLSYAVL